MYTLVGSRNKSDEGKPRCYSNYAYDVYKKAVDS